MEREPSKAFAIDSIWAYKDQGCHHAWKNVFMGINLNLGELPFLILHKKYMTLFEGNF